MNTKSAIEELRSGLLNSTKEVKMKEEFARTGCHLLDIFFGGGRGLGIPYGHMINLCGDSGSGKSMLGNEIIAAEYHRRKEKFHHQYEDAENGNEFDTTDLYGVDIMGTNLLLSHPNAKKMKKVPDTVEDMDARATLFINMLPKNHFGIYFTDSLDALTDETNQQRNKKRAEEYEKGKQFDEGTYGTGGARFLSQEFFKNQGAKTRLPDKNVIIALVSQVRQVMGATKYQKQLRTTGGKAKKHWMDIEVWFKIIKKLSNPNSDLINGLYVEVSGVKSRDGRMERSARFLFYPDYGIDDIGTSIDYLFDLRGDSGELKAAAKDIPWGGEGKPKADLDGVTAWLNAAEGRLDAYREFRNEIDGKKNIKASIVIDFSQSSEELKTAFKEYFGNTYSREDLRAACVADLAMKKELDKRVLHKWEELEKQARSGLGKKYG